MELTLSKGEEMLLNDLLSFMPMFSPFSIHALISLEDNRNYKTVAEISQFTDTYKMDGTNYNPTDILLERYLDEGGFIIQRRDLNYEENLIQLTDEGRKLKNSGSMKANVFVLYRKPHHQNASKDGMGTFFWIQLWIMVGALAATIYYTLEILRTQYHLGLPHHVWFC